MSAHSGLSHDPGRLEPFIGISLVLHAILLALIAPALMSDALTVSMGEGAVVRIIPVPAGPSGHGVLNRPGAPGTAGAAPAKPRAPAAAQVYAEKPKPPTRPLGTTAAKPPGKSAPGVAQEKPPVKGPVPAAKEVLTSERSPSVAAVSAAPARPRAGSDEPGQVGEEGTPSQGPVTRPDSSGTGGTGKGEAPPGPPVGDPTASLVGEASPSPVYPKNAVTYGMQGRVVLTVTANADGTIREVTVKQSSGAPALDDFARRWVMGEWKLLPSSGRRAYQFDVAFDFEMPVDAQGRVQPKVSYQVLTPRVTYL